VVYFVVSAFVSFFITAFVVIYNAPPAVISKSRVTPETSETRYFLIILSIFLSMCVLIVMLKLSFDIGSARQLVSLLSGRWFVQCVFGCAFGTLFAVWLRKVYALRPRDSFPWQMRIESVILLLLFLVGATSTPLSELVTGWANANISKIKAGPVELEMRAAASAIAPKANNIAPPFQNDGERKAAVPRADEEIGLYTISDLHTRMRQDAARIRESAALVADEASPARIAALAKAEEIEAAAGQYEAKISRLALCMMRIIQTTRDDQYARSLLVGLKPNIAEAYYLTLARLQGESSSKTLVQDIASELGSALGRSTRKVKTHAQRILATVAAVEAQPGACAGLTIDPYSRDELAGVIAAQRPYIAILYASLLQLDHQEPIGVEVLDTWLARYEAASKASPDVSDYWIRLRILSEKYLLYESLFRRQPMQERGILEAHIANISALIDHYMSNADVVASYNAIFHNDAIDLQDAEFEAAAQYRLACPKEVEDNVDRLRLSFALLLAKSVYVLRATKHPEFSTRYYLEANGFADEIVNADYGCLAAKQSDSFARLTMAEHIRVYLQLALAGLKDPAGSIAWDSGAQLRQFSLMREAAKYGSRRIDRLEGAQADRLKEDFGSVLTYAEAAIRDLDR
jgi:hypothetical protein